jgi:hypothetical protein
MLMRTLSSGGRSQRSCPPRTTGRRHPRLRDRRVLGGIRRPEPGRADRRVRRARVARPPQGHEGRRMPPSTRRSRSRGCRRRPRRAGCGARWCRRSAGARSRGCGRPAAARAGGRARQSPPAYAREAVQPDVGPGHLQTERVELGAQLAGREAAHAGQLHRAIAHLGHRAQCADEVALGVVAQRIHLQGDRVRSHTCSFASRHRAGCLGRPAARRV